MPVGGLSTPVVHNLAVLMCSIIIEHMCMRSQITQLDFFRSLCILFYAGRVAVCFRISSSPEVFLLFLLLQFVRRGNSSSYSLSFFLVGIFVRCLCVVHCSALMFSFLFLVPLWPSFLPETIYATILQLCIAVSIIALLLA